MKTKSRVPHSVALAGLILLPGCRWVDLDELRASFGSGLEDRPLASGIDIVDVLLYQGTEVVLVEDRVVQTPSVPIAAGRDALVRILVAPRKDWQEREIAGRLYLYSDGDVIDAVEATLQVDEASDAFDLDSSINIRVDGSSLAPGISYAVELVETSDSEGPGDLGSAALPDSGTQPLDVTEGGSLRILLIPIRYDADGSGRTPDTSTSTVDDYESIVWSVFPADEVIMDVAESLPWDNPLSPSGTGWSELLAAVADDRSDLGASDDVYLFGLVNPSADLGEFCGSGCITGLSSVSATATDAFNRSSIGIGYGDEISAWGMLHQLAHAHGRSHAPGCGAAGTDESYPYKEGFIGNRGFDLVGGEIKEADEYFDVTGYCVPQWLSDYTWTALFERIAEVNAAYR